MTKTMLDTDLPRGVSAWAYWREHEDPHGWDSWSLVLQIVDLTGEPIAELDIGGGRTEDHSVIELVADLLAVAKAGPPV